MEASHLIWKEGESRELFRSKIFSIRETESRSPNGETRSFTVMDAPDWVIVVPLLETERGRCFIMVRQWRHGSRELSLEFPGGVMEKGESAEEGAKREFEEETAYRALNLCRLGGMSPNPAIMSNRVHFYLAENLAPLPSQKLDDDEFVDVECIPVADVIGGMGKPPFVHALTAAALALYMSRRENILNNSR
ncbi:MAG: NUDIX hydrolase [Treponema sp.]|jgi:8-oxo-dGTP pyrophosphatase MutT (NUDIX family)|nr:NUDIX hydrolase [Treponema sp.]